MTIKAVLFDKDGTLLDFGVTFAPATKQVIEDLARGDEALAHQLAEVLRFDMQAVQVMPHSVLIAGSIEDIAEAIAHLTPRASRQELVQEINILFVTNTKQSVTAFPYLEDTLAKLHAMGLQLGVATNDSELGAQTHLKIIGATNHFTFIAGSDSGYGAKPGGGMVRAFAEHCGVQPHEVIMVGDSEHDCMAGKDAGATAIGLTCGGATQADLTGFADHIFPDIRALPEFIKGQNQ